MAKHSNQQHIPGSHLRGAEGWSILENREEGSKKTAKALREFNGIDPDPDLEERKETEFGENLKEFGNFYDE